MITSTSIRRCVRAEPSRQHPSGTSRSVRAVIIDHLERCAIGDIEGDISDNYAADVLVLAPGGGLHGADGVRRWGAELADALGPGAFLDYQRLWIDGPLGYLEWTASGPVVRYDGAETLVVSDGRIIAQTVHYGAGGVDGGSADR